MKYSRRDLRFLFPAMLAGAASAQNQGENVVEKLPVLTTKAYVYDELPVRENGKNRSRAMFTAKTHTGFKMESHQSDIAPGEVNHPPHRHLREEMMLVREGIMELTISGKPYRLGPGDVGVIGSNELHNARNVGTTRAQYFIVNIGRDDV